MSPSSKLGTALLLPAPIINMEPAELSDLVTLAIFCNFDNSPAVVETNNSSPSEKLDVSNPLNLPNVYIETEPFKLASAATTPKAGILAASSASALETTVVFPEMPDI